MKGEVGGVIIKNMSPWNLMPTNKYTYIGFGLLILGIVTLPIFIGIFFIAIASIFLVIGFHKMIYDIIKSIYSTYQTAKKYINIKK